MQKNGRKRIPAKHCTLSMKAMQSKIKSITTQQHLKWK